MNQQHLKARAVAQLRQAVQTMRNACYVAERDLVTGDSYACQRVLHSLSWGMANASSSIETAMSNVEDCHIVAAFERQP